MNRNKNKLLIALITNNDDDVYCFRLELIHALIEAGYNVLVSCPYGPKFELMRDTNYIFDNPVIDRRGTNPLNDYKLFMHYKNLFKKYKPDIILTYTAKPNVYAGLAASNMNIPYISNVTGIGSVQNKRGLIQAIIMRLFKFSYTKAACIMFQNSENLKMAIKCGWIKGDFKLIPGSGVNTDRYPFQKYPLGGNGVEGEIIVFNYIGRILHDKGVDDYIEAARRIKLKYPKTQFNLLGFIEPSESHYKVELDKLREAGIVQYLGSQNDIKPYIAKSHATIHPSTYGEGMSNVLLESASSGRPLITTDNPGCRETVDDEVTGFIYPGGNVDLLVDKIETFLHMSNSARANMGINGRNKVNEEFSRKIVVSAYLDKIKELSRFL